MNGIFSMLVASADHGMVRQALSEELCLVPAEDLRPVIRLMGATPSGQQACLHLHGFYNYLYLRPESLVHFLFDSREKVERLLPALHSALETLLRNYREGQKNKLIRHFNAKPAQTKQKNHTASKPQEFRLVRRLEVVSRQSFYGFMQTPLLFVKVWVNNPRDVARIYQALEDSQLLGMDMNCYEAHIPYLLKFFTDFNVKPMDWIDLSNLRFRNPLLDDSDINLQVSNVSKLNDESFLNSELDEISASFTMPSLQSPKALGKFSSNLSSPEPVQRPSVDHKSSLKVRKKLKYYLKYYDRTDNPKEVQRRLKFSTANFLYTKSSLPSELVWPQSLSKYFSRATYSQLEVDTHVSCIMNNSKKRKNLSVKLWEMEKKRWKKLGEDFIPLPTLESASHCSASGKNEIKIKYPTQYDYDKRFEMLKKKGVALKKRFMPGLNSKKTEDRPNIDVKIGDVLKEEEESDSSSESADSDEYSSQDGSDTDQNAPNSLDNQRSQLVMSDSFLRKIELGQPLFSIKSQPTQPSQSTQLTESNQLNSPQTGSPNHLNNSLDEFLNNSDCYSQLFSQLDKDTQADDNSIAEVEFEKDKNLEDWLNMTLIEENQNMFTQTKKINLFLQQDQEIDIDHNFDLILSPIDSLQSKVESFKPKPFSKKLNLSQGDLVCLSEDEDEEEEGYKENYENLERNNLLQETQDILSATQFDEEKESQELKSSLENSNQSRVSFQDFSPIPIENKFSIMSPSAKKRNFTYHLSNNNEEFSRSPSLKSPNNMFTPKSILKKSRLSIGSSNKSVSFVTNPVIVNEYTQFSQTLSGSVSPNQHSPEEEEPKPSPYSTKRKIIKRQDAFIQARISQVLLVPSFSPPNSKSLRPLCEFDQLDTLNERVFYSAKEDETKFLPKLSKFQLEIETNNLSSFYNNDNIVFSSDFISNFDGGNSTIDNYYSPNQKSKVKIIKKRTLFPSFSPPSYAQVFSELQVIEQSKGAQKKVELVPNSTCSSSDPSYSAHSTSFFSSKIHKKKKIERIAKTLTLSLELFSYPQGIHSSSIISKVSYESLPPKSPFYRGGLSNLKSKKKKEGNMDSEYTPLINPIKDFPLPQDNLTPDPREDPILGITWVIRDSKTSEAKRDISYKSGVLFLLHPPSKGFEINKKDSHQKLRKNYSKRNILVQQRHKLYLEFFDLDTSIRNFSQTQFKPESSQLDQNILNSQKSSPVFSNSNEFDEGCLRKSVIESELIAIYNEINELEKLISDEEASILRNILNSTKSSNHIDSFNEFSSIDITPCFDEVEMIREIIRLFHFYDPDFTLSYTQHASSFNYLTQRAAVFGINFILSISRGLPYIDQKSVILDDTDVDEEEGGVYPFNNYFTNSVTRLLEKNEHFCKAKNWSLYLISLEKSLELITNSEETFLRNIYPKIKKMNDSKAIPDINTDAPDESHFFNEEANEGDMSQIFSQTEYINSNKIKKDDFFQLYIDNIEINISGRNHFTVWDILRKEEKLSHFNISYLAAELLGQHFPVFSQSQLSTYFIHHSISSSSRGLLFHHLLNHNLLNFKLLEKIDFFIKIFEFSKIYCISPVEIYSRGSQLRVEAALLSLTHKYDYILLSAKKGKVSGFMKSIEELPLIIEPDSGFYTDPVVVLDFRSLYPSIVCANNLCYSTAIGHLRVGKPNDLEGNVSPETSQKLGVVNYPEALSAINSTICTDEDSSYISPCGTIFVSKNIRRGVLPEFLEDLLTARITLKTSLKKCKAYLDRQKNDPNFNQPPLSPDLLDTLDNKQLAVKLLANVTYGYAAAGFSGRMPMTEIADSIVSESHSLLHSSLTYIQTNQEKWERERLKYSSCFSTENFSQDYLNSIRNRVKVIYGDTDSLFIHMPGYSLEQAFHVGNYIATSISESLPTELELCFEKVFFPSLLVTKKRYGGLAFENINQIKEYEEKKNLIFNSFKAFNIKSSLNSAKEFKLVHPPSMILKGLEAIRQDQCKLVQKIQFFVLFLLFFSKDLTLVKSFLYESYNFIIQISEGRIHNKDFDYLSSFIGKHHSKFIHFYEFFNFYYKDCKSNDKFFNHFISINDFYLTRNVREAKKNKQEEALDTEDLEKDSNAVTNKNVLNFMHKKKGFQGEITPLGVLLEKQSERDHLSRPPLSWRLPFLVINGPPNSLLKNLVVSPEEFQTTNTHRINSVYYISKCINASLERILILCGVKLSQWYSNWPRIQTKPRSLTISPLIPVNYVGNTKTGKNMSSFITRGQCECCSKNDALPLRKLCAKCLEENKLESLLILNDRMNKKNLLKQKHESICKSCLGFKDSRSTNAYIRSCKNYECNILLHRNMLDMDIEDLDKALEQLEETL